jgi:hypothetical protein
MLRMGLFSRVALFSLVSVIFWTACVVSQKGKMVVTAHFFLNLFSFLNPPVWLCRLIIPRSAVGDSAGVVSSDCVLTHNNVSVPYRFYIPKNEHNASSVLVWAHGECFCQMTNVLTGGVFVWWNRRRVCFGFCV